MSIKAKLDQLKLAVEAEHPNTSIGDGLMDAALPALLAGVHSAEWKTLMKNFTDADNPAQLARLTFNDSMAADPVVRENVLHLAALAACGAKTITMTGDYIDPAVLDKTLACQPGDGGDTES